MADILTEPAAREQLLPPILADPDCMISNAVPVDATADNVNVVSESRNDAEVNEPKREEDDVPNIDDAAALEKAAAEAAAEHPRDPLYFRRKKFAMLIGYSGTGYRGLQWSHQAKTIERDVFEAMAAGEVLHRSALTHPSNFSFQRCARTDKGVSAVTNVMSLVLAPSVADRAKESTNAHLPAQIRVFDIFRSTKGFDAKNQCSSRSYIYIMPTFALAPVEHALKIDYRLPEDSASAIVERVNKLLKNYIGTKNFHNFTRDIKPWEPQARRYIMECRCGEPFVRDDIEFVQFTVRGQSFMMHQIRKMIGLIVAIMRGSADENVFEQVFDTCKVRVPKVPGLGLLLEQVHMDMYNDRFCKDDSHKKVCIGDDIAQEVADFKEKMILPSIIKGEKEDLSMLTWLGELLNHKVAVHAYIELRRMVPTAIGEAARVAADAEAQVESPLSSDADDDIEEAKEDETKNEGESSDLASAATKAKGRIFPKRDAKQQKYSKRRRVTYDTLF